MVMRSSETFVVVGASLAGAKAAETLRGEGFEGRVVLVGEEPARPYERPPLSKEYLRGEKGFDHAAVHPASFYSEKDIELRTSTEVTRIDPSSHEVGLSSGEKLRYDKLLLATGCSPRRLRVPGADLEGVFYLRTVADADAMREALKSAGRVVVVGGGWIGAEVAASARQLGAEAAMVELTSLPLETALGREMGAFYRDLHARHGVELHLGQAVEAFEGAKAVEGVRLFGGAVLPAQVVVVGIGVSPRDELARTAGLAVDNGIITDEFLATSAPDVYAAGDVANALHPAYGQRVRLEHWSAALNQGPVAAKNMLGQSVPYDKIPFFYSDQYEHSMEWRGWAPSFDEVVFRGDRESGQFLAFWLQGGRVVAAMNANIWDAADKIEALLRSRATVRRDKLADPDVDLASLTGAR
jgi:3-phenylpropionate/trans-cinnamate dioxygenase ferredoxin reductase subunit